MRTRTEAEIIKNWPEDYDTPFVTVLAVSYCHKKYLHTALDSVLAQETSFPFEVVVHDDASPDGSASIIREYAEKYPHIVLPVLEDENQFSKGAQAIFMALKSKIKGRYIAFLDCDDYWTDVHKLQEEADYLEAHPAFLAAAHNCTVVDADGKPNGEQYPECRDEEFTAEHFFNNILAGQFSTLMIRDFLTKNLDDHPLFMNAPPGPFDRVLNLTLLLNGRVHCIQKSMSAYRHVTDSGTSYSATLSYDIKRDARFYLSFVTYCKKIGRIGDAIGMLRWFIEYTENYRDEGFTSLQEKESMLAFCRSYITCLTNRLTGRSYRRNCCDQLVRYESMPIEQQEASVGMKGSASEDYAFLAVYIRQPGDSCYSEEKCVYTNAAAEKRYNCVTSLSAFGEIEGLRIDPMQDPCILRNISAILLTADGGCISAPVIRTNAISFRDALIFDNDDPQIEVRIPKGSYKAVAFSCELISRDPEEIGYLRETAMTTSGSLHSDAVRQELEEQLAAARRDLDTISSSTFWKITGPARAALDALKRVLHL